MAPLPLQVPQAQLPFVNERNQLNRPAMNFLQSLVTLIQGPGGIMDTLMLLQNYDPAGTAQQLQALQDQIGQVGAQFTALAAQPVALLMPGAMAGVAARGDLTRMEVVPAAAPTLVPVSVPPGYAQYFEFSNGARFLSGTGSPEGSVYGSVGDLYTRTDGSAGQTLYIKETGANTNMGWGGLGGIGN